MAERNPSSSLRITVPKRGIYSAPKARIHSSLGQRPRKVGHGIQGLKARSNWDGLSALGSFGVTGYLGLCPRLEMTLAYGAEAELVKK